MNCFECNEPHGSARCYTDECYHLSIDPTRGEDDRVLSCDEYQFCADCVQKIMKEYVRKKETGI